MYISIPHFRSAASDAAFLQHRSVQNHIIFLWFQQSRIRDADGCMRNLYVVFSVADHKLIHIGYPEQSLPLPQRALTKEIVGDNIKLLQLPRIDRKWAWYVAGRKGMGSMRILAAEEDFASRKFLARYLQRFGVCDLVVDGKEAVEAFGMALEERKPYDLACLNIQMCAQVIEEMRSLETAQGILGEKAVKVVLMDVQDQREGTEMALEMRCAAYYQKPLNTEKFKENLIKMKLL